MIAGTLLLALTLPAAEPDATYLPSESSPLVALRVIVKAGSQLDPPGKEGLAALTAAMIAEGGTKELSYDQVLRRFYPMAASLSGACRKEVVVFSGTIHRDNLDAYAKLMADMITGPRFAREDFDRLKTDAMDYLTKVLRGGNDEELGKWALQLALWGKDHPYGHVDAGTVAGLEAITLDDVKEFHRKYYVDGTVRVGVAGGAHEAFAQGWPKAIRDGLGDGDPGMPRLPEPPQPAGLGVTIVAKPSAESTAISLGFPIDVTRRDDDFYALAVANSYLGEHRTFNGKLMQDLRGKRGLNYGDYSYVEDFIQEGPSTFPVPNNPRRQQAFTIWVRPVPHDKAGFALRAALWELDRLVNEGMSAEDFEATRSFLLNYSKLWVQTLSRRLGYEMEGTFYDREDLVQELSERLPKLTVDQVNAAVRKHLKSGGIRAAIVTKDTEGFARMLKEGSPTPLVYDTEGTPEAIVAEDKVIGRFPLGKVSVTIVPVQGMFAK